MTFIMILILVTILIPCRGMDNSGNSTTTTHVEKIIEGIKGNNIAIDNSGTSSTVIAVIIKNITIEKLTKSTD